MLRSSNVSPKSNSTTTTNHRRRVYCARCCGKFSSPSRYFLSFPLIFAKHQLFFFFNELQSLKKTKTKTHWSYFLFAVKKFIFHDFNIVFGHYQVLRLFVCCGRELIGRMHIVWDVWNYIRAARGDERSLLPYIYTTYLRLSLLFTMCRISKWHFKRSISVACCCFFASPSPPIPQRWGKCNFNFFRGQKKINNKKRKANFFTCAFGNINNSPLSLIKSKTRGGAIN